MGQIMAIDYGLRRTGVAVTDDAQIIATGLETVATNEIWIFLNDYLANHQVDRMLVGDPKDLQGSATDATQAANGFCKRFEKRFPHIPLERWDERFTSKMAVQSMIAGGMKKKDRRKKGNIDQISATLMLQEYLQYR